MAHCAAPPIETTDRALTSKYAAIFCFNRPRFLCLSQFCFTPLFPAPSATGQPSLWCFLRRLNRVSSWSSVLSTAAHSAACCTYHGLAPISPKRVVVQQVGSRNQRRPSSTRPAVAPLPLNNDVDEQERLFHSVHLHPQARSGAASAGVLFVVVSLSRIMIATQAGSAGTPAPPSLVGPRGAGTGGRSAADSNSRSLPTRARRRRPGGSLRRAHDANTVTASVLSRIAVRKKGAR